jgi:hypothetical protein
MKNIKNQNIPSLEELENLIEDIKNGKNLNLDNTDFSPEIIDTLKVLIKNIDQIQADPAFYNDLQTQLEQKIQASKIQKTAQKTVKNREKETQKNSEKSFFSGIFSFFAQWRLVFGSGAFVSIAILGLAFWNNNGIENSYIQNFTPENISSHSQNSPVLNRFDANTYSSFDLKNEADFKERKNAEVFERKTKSGVDKFLSGVFKGDAEYAESEMLTESLAEGEMDKSEESFSVTTDTIVPPSVAVSRKMNTVKNDLKGGEIDDNENFKQYKEYFLNAVKGNGYDIDISQRFIIRLTHKQKGVFGEDIKITDDLGNAYRLKTDTNGELYFYPSVYTVDDVQPQQKKCEYFDQDENFYPEPRPVPYGEETETIIREGEKKYTSCRDLLSGYYFDEISDSCVKASKMSCTNPYPFQNKEECEQTCIKEKRSFEYPQKFLMTVQGEKYEFSADQKEWNLDLKNYQTPQEELVLDLAFTLDTTGSMSDQIEKLKMTIESISKEVVSLPSKPKIRYGLVVYRDRTDQYITRIYDFTDDLEKFQKILNTIDADGGGDYPEDVNTALADTLEELSWSTQKNALRVSFLIADAPPHMDYGQKYNYRTAMLRSLELGVKIFPLASSGLDNTEGEFMFRQIALITNAKYLFITNKQGATDYHVDRQDYSVETLDQLIVKLIGEELSLLNQ